MSATITHAEIKFIVDRPWASCSVTDWILVGNYIAQNRERDVKDAERAETLEEFRQKFIARSENLQRYGDETMEKDRETLADWAFDNIPQLEPKPDKLDGLVAALEVSNDSRKCGTRQWVLCDSSGNVTLTERGVGQRTIFERRSDWMSPDGMIDHLEKQAPVPRSQAAKAARRIRTGKGVIGDYDLVDRYFNPKEGESDE